nr:glycosyltransferase family 9 protein [Polynucleobacter sp. MWH-Berg-3C6]
MNCLGLIRRLKTIDWDLGIEIRGDVRQILLLSLCGPIRRVGFAFTGGKQLLSDVVPDDGSYAHLANHHQRIAEFLGIWPVGKKYLPQLILKDSEIREAKKIPPYVGFHFGASLPLRRLPDRESLVLLTHWLKKDVPVVLFVPPGDADRLNQLISGLPVELSKNLALWSGGLRNFVVMLSRAKRLFLMDSGPAHIAAALGIRTTVIFGSNNSELVRPLGANVEIVEKKNVPCRPCNQRNCHHPQKLFCMTGLVVDENNGEDNINFGEA